MCKIANDVKIWEEEEEEDINDDYVNAFVSMGGNNDRSGFVKKDTIIDIVKNVFELSIDMEDFLEKVGALQEELDFQSFCLLFEGGEDTKSLSRASSLLSLVSDRYRNKRKDSTASFNVKYRDFEKFVARGQADKFFGNDF
mmetsp:Transcript_10416/g.8948  ORF Transcript_10416/g.8948 Transcript_10416/m.8948 type:complete len:141 (-) Transcript_10416:197-619(-)|eukprot:CAMPEP_0114585628 /NCGR_PEP_ID=MMETSP0125-20121206/9105_1 /TAXON_ID=485358 ORGANISM="Aristerostoma sp., Strain ATCC 50986" /NCGR_SAMPLE_ID=MMETSP0125 /ASSEMBLY_ACC=CAM_ASM_000245 /LENGTH=140 /DNA_ID=CAMNT_0001780763 /DNA_START=332 /DNA_END=754 /DNA_ORIENTATION=+